MLKLILQTVLIFSTCIHIFAFAKAGINIVADNKCHKTLNYRQLSSSQSEQLKVIKPNSSKDLNYVTTGYFTQTYLTKSIQVSDENNKLIGEIKFHLSNNWLSNDFNVFYVHGDVTVDLRDLSWKNIYGTPNFTITACPIHIKDRTGSLLEGVDRVVIFGDSLSDKGTLHEYSLGVIPNARHYYDGVFSNGPVWTMLLERDLLEKNVNVSNYAVGGSTAVFHFNFKDLPYSIAGQKKVFADNANDEQWKTFDRFLNFIFIGANDYTEASPDMTQEILDDTTNNVIAAIKEHVDALISDYGMGKFVLITLPNLALTPKSKTLGNGNITEKLTHTHNLKLKQLVTQYQNNYPKKAFRLVDIDPIFSEMVLDSEKINKNYDLVIQDHSTPCWPGGYFENEDDLEALLKDRLFPKSLLDVSKDDVICEHPEHHLFFDHLHPTKQIHRTLYIYIMGELGVNMVDHLDASFKEEL